MPLTMKMSNHSGHSGSIVFLVVICLLVVVVDAFRASIRLTQPRTSRQGDGRAHRRFKLQASVDGSSDESAPSLLGPVGRRRFLVFSLVGPASLILSPVMAVHADADEGQSLTSQLFNPDGSLKEAVEEAKSRTVSLKWERSDDPQSALDGVSTGGTKSGDYVGLSYQLPEKWKDLGANDLYVDSSEGANVRACKRIIVYKTSTKVDQLEKATTIGVGKALNVPPELDKIRTADLIGGRKTNKNGQKYYEFDLASAPATCGDSHGNLGLGFCPFDTIFLLSATVLDDSLYVIAVECDDQEWKQGSADLKRVRSSFTVELL